MAGSPAIVSVKQRAPEPTVDRLEELASRILKGDILLPKFQRDFVWEKHQVIDLLDSISNNYPVGSVLLWRSRERLRSERNISDLAIADTQEDYPVNYLLDGQQRLSTICGALYWNGSDPDSKWNLAYDLRNKKFSHLNTLDDPPSHQIRLNKIPDPSAFFGQVAALDTLSAPDKGEMKTAAKELFDRFKDYKIATVTLHEMSLEAVAPIFERINSKGTPLTIVDLMRAATWSEEFDLIDSIEEILSELEAKNFGGIERKTILRSLSASAGGGFSESSIDQLRKHGASELKAAAGNTKVAYAKAVDFLSTEIHIPADSQLPYANQIVVLGELFRVLPKPNASQLMTIREWFWRSAVSGYFGGWNTGNMAADQLAVHRFAENKTVEIDLPATKPSINVWSSQGFRSNSARSKILILLLSFNKPIDLLTGAKIDTYQALYQGNNKEFHHFFPRDYLKNHKNVGAARANILSNIVMLTASSNKIITNRAPSDYLKDCQLSLGPKFQDALDANLISSAALSAAMNDDYDLFISERSKTLDETASRLARW
ncbi:DUF262 domain-containing protein [Methylobacterium sp. M6A4_1b]